MAKPPYRRADWYIGKDGRYYIWNEGSKTFKGPSNDPGVFNPLTDEKGRQVIPRSTDPQAPVYGPPVPASILNQIGKYKFSARPVPGKDKSLRYPNLIRDKNTDYVMFRFGQYQPPFSKPSDKNDGITKFNKYTEYNRTTQSLTEVPGVSPIILYMPQDIQSETKGNWQGKSFSNLGKTALQVTGGNVSGLNNYDLGQGMNNAIKALITGAINQVPGVGGNLTLNDTLQSQQGVMLNPNVEVLFDSPELREFTLKFKMIPQNGPEAVTIKQICNTFRKASLPFFERNPSKDQKAKELAGGNVIGVPLVVEVSFMKGSGLHEWLPQYKQCVIQSVKVNYTPDGAYATYQDGSPVATELIVSFLETKLVFAEEIQNAGSGATL